MARVTRRAKKDRRGKRKLLEVISDTKRGIRAEDTFARRDRERKKKETPVQDIREPIEAKRPEKTLGQKALGVLTSPKTTLALATTLIPGGLALKGAGAVAKGATAVITRTAFRGKASLTTQRAFVGRSTKKEIKEAMENNFKVKVEKVNTLIQKGKKKAYIRLSKDNPAIDIATKLGLM